MNEQRKVYTLEDNVKYISFGLKDVVKELQSLNATLMALTTKLEKSDDDKSLPF